jgi:integrase
MSAAIPLTQYEEDILLASLLSSPAPERDKCIMMFGLRSGLRVGEIALLTWDILLDEKLKLRKIFYTLPGKITKGGKSRKVFFNPELSHAIYQHFLVNFTDRKDRVFLTDANKPFTENNLTVWMFRRLKKHGLNGSSHSLRKKFATDYDRVVHKKGGSIIDTRDALGHSNISTTQRYISKNYTARIEAMMAL